MPDDGDPCEIVKKLSFREAKKRFKISFEKWHALKNGQPCDWKPFRGGRCTPLDVKEVLDSVRSKPHLATGARARWLGRRTEAVQRVLKEAGLSRLTARLKYAGYSVDVTGSLSRARQHRILAGGPGVYTNVDFKRLGSIRRLEPGDRQETSRLVCGLQCVDAYTGFASCYLCEREDTTNATAGFKRYVETAPFPVRGLVLTDNGLPFLSDEFLGYCKLFGFVTRTTRYHHPWSNGKVEAFNKTLKYQAMPALVAAGIKSIEQAQAWLDKWLEFYNTKRVHQGWINKGLPPVTVLEQWNKATGDVFEKLVTLGHIRQDEVQRTRLMGSGKHAYDPGLKAKDFPYAFVIESKEAMDKKPLPAGWTLAK